MVTQLFQHANGLARNVTDHGRCLSPAPFLPTPFDLREPSRICVETALGYEKLKQVFQHWPETTATDRDVKRRKVVRTRVLRLGEEMGQRSAVGMHLYMGVRSGIHLTLIIES